MQDPETNQLLYDIESAMGKLLGNLDMMNPNMMGGM